MGQTKNSNTLHNHTPYWIVSQVEFASIFLIILPGNVNGVALPGKQHSFEKLIKNIRERKKTIKLAKSNRVKAFEIQLRDNLFHVNFWDFC